MKRLLIVMLITGIFHPLTAISAYNLIASKPEHIVVKRDVPQGILAIDYKRSDSLRRDGKAIVLPPKPVIEIPKQEEQPKIVQPKPKINNIPTHVKQNVQQSPTDIDGLLQKYFGANWQAAKAVAKCESGLNPKAHNYNPKTRDNSYGLFQINLYGNLANSRPRGDWLLNAENNIRYASELHKRSGWGPWSCKRVLR